MSRRPASETERVIRFAIDFGGRLSHVLGEAIPDEAKRHLLNAQRELITALVIMYEHQAGARRAPLPRRRASSPSRPAAARKPRTTRIKVD
jgi:hypothetical protein